MTSENETAVAASKPKFIPRDGLVFERVVTLKYPLEWNGVVYESITIRRPTIREWRTYLIQVEEAEKTGGPGAGDSVPMPWVLAPVEILDNLDFLDGAEVEIAQSHFFGGAK